VHRFTIVVERIDGDSGRAWNHRSEAGETKAAFEEKNLWPGEDRQLRIHQDVKWNWLSFTVAKLRLRESGVIFRFIFDHCQLQRQSDLGSGQADSRSIVQCFPHVLDQFASLRAADFLNGESPSSRPQYRFSGGDDLEFHFNRPLYRIT
jgi:hypothetical protein